jgi:hypothetical protein
MLFAPLGTLQVKMAGELEAGDRIVNVGQVVSVEPSGQMFVTVVLVTMSWSAETGASVVHNVAAYLHRADDVVVEVAE